MDWLALLVTLGVGLIESDGEEEADTVEDGLPERVGDAEEEEEWRLDGEEDGEVEREGEGECVCVADVDVVIDCEPDGEGVDGAVTVVRGEGLPEPVGLDVGAVEEEGMLLVEGVAVA